MGVFDWFRRSPATKTTEEADPSEPSGSGGVRTLVADPSATSGGVTAQVPAQKSVPEPAVRRDAERKSATDRSADSDGPGRPGGAGTKPATDPQPPGSGGESEGERDMGLLDSIKEKLAHHPDKVEKGVDKAADMAEKKTGGKYGKQIDAGAEKAKDALGVPDEAAPAPEAPPAPGQIPPEERPPA